MKKLIPAFIGAAAALFMTASAQVVGGSCGFYGGDNVKWSLDTQVGELRIYGQGEMSDWLYYYFQPEYRPEYLNYDESINRITVEKGVTTVGCSAFSRLSNVKTVSLSNTVTKIKDRAFSFCANLTRIDIPIGVKSIHDEAFFNCKSLTSASLPEGLTYIGAAAFADCTSLSEVNFPSTLAYIGDDSFFSTAIKSAVLPEGLTQLPSAAFNHCKEMENIRIPSSATLEISQYGSYFAGCSSLKEITVGAGNKYVKTVDGVLFSADGKILVRYPPKLNKTEYSIPQGTLVTASAAFDGCSLMEKLTVPPSVTSIGDFPYGNMKEYIIHPENNFYKTDGAGVIYTNKDLGYEALQSYAECCEEKSYSAANGVRTITDLIGIPYLAAFCFVY